jgi:hypothetical protein
MMVGKEITPAEITEFQNVYSPGTLLGVFASAIRSPVDGKIVLAKGIYQQQPHSKVYGEYFYDIIKSPYENKHIKIRIPGILRNKLENNQVYLFKGFMEKKINFSAIELTFVIDEVLQKEESNVSEEDQKRFALIQKKITKGYHDLEFLVKSHIYKNEVFQILNLYGNNAIVNKDFEKGLAEAAPRFKITEHRCNFSSAGEIRECLNALAGSSFNAVAIVRGGGDAASLEIFNDPALGAASLNLQPLLITALGHTVNETLLDKLADKKFALPHDYGNTLKVWVDAATEEQSKSKSIFINQVRTDLTRTFHDQIASLQNQLLTRNKEFAENELKFKMLLEQHQKERAETVKTLETAFNTHVHSLQEQLKIQENSAVNLRSNFDKSVEQWTGQNMALRDQLQKRYSRRLVIGYVLLAIILGLILGILIR